MVSRVVFDDAESSFFTVHICTISYANDLAEWRGSRRGHVPQWRGVGGASASVPHGW